jgi:hypothetical protein
MRVSSSLRSGLATAVLALVGLALAPTRAFAAGGGADDGTTLTVVLLLLGVAGAYLLAHFVVDQLQTRFLVLPGVEYLVLGLLLAAAVPSDVLDLTSLLPIIALATGWTGLLRGMGLDKDTRRGWPPHTMRIAFVHHALAGLVVGIGFWLFVAFGWSEFFFGLDVEALGGADDVAAAAFVLGCCAAAESAEPFELLARRYPIEGDLAKFLEGASRFGDLLLLVVFGLVFCIWHPRPGGALQTLSATEWGAIQFGLGVILGFLFTPFAGGENTAQRFLAMVGVITFTSGAAFFLDLSPLSTNVLLGIVLVNAAKAGKSIRDTVTTSAKPMHLLLLMLAGALWQPPPFWLTFWTTSAFVVVRLLAKMLGSAIAAWGIAGMRKDLYRGFLAHGEVTVAMAISFQVVFESPVVDVVYTAALVSTVIHDVGAPRVLRSLLVDAGAIRREHAASPRVSVPPPSVPPSSTSDTTPVAPSHEEIT